MALGLAVKVADDVYIVSPLDAHKDHELMVVGSKRDKNWIRAVYLAYQAFRYGALFRKHFEHQSLNWWEIS